MDEDMLNNGTDAVTADAQPIKSDDDDMATDDPKADITDHEDVEGEEWDDTDDEDVEDDEADNATTDDKDEDF